MSAAEKKTTKPTATVKAGVVKPEAKAPEKETVKKTAAAKKPAAKKTVTKEEKPVEKKTTTAKKAAPAKAEAKKTETKTAAAKKPAAKKTVAKKAELNPTVVLQFNGNDYTQERLVQSAKDVWQYDFGRDVADIKELQLYVKPEENKVYVVVNGSDADSYSFDI